MNKNTKIRADREGLLTIKPFDGSDLEVRFNIERIKNKPRPFPHNMQTNNKQLLQVKYYHLFDGEAAIKVEHEEHIDFFYKLFKDAQIKILKTKYPYNKMGTYLVIIGYDIINCNPHFTEKQLYDCLYHIFLYYIQIPKLPKILDYSEKIGNIGFTEKNRLRVQKAASKVYNNPFKGRIKKKAKVIFNPDYDLTTQEKREISNKLIGANKKEDRIEEICSTLINWNSKEKPTQKNIAKELEVSLRTVKTYWKAAKERLATI